MRFLYLGQLRREKGLDDIVSATETLLERGLDFSVTIAGPITGWVGDTYPNKLVERVSNDARLARCIAFLGKIDDPAAAFGAHDVHLAPSVYEEPFGLVVVEAKLAGRPSVIYPSGGMIELIENEVDGLICKRKSSLDLSAAMAALIADPDLVHRLGRNAALSIQRLGLTREDFGHAWRSLIEEMI